MPIKQVKISEILGLLKSGYTRWEVDAVEPGMSIETVLALSTADLKSIFSHAKVKRVKTQFKTIEIIDDVEAPAATLIIEDDTPGQQGAPAFQAQINSVVSTNRQPTPGAARAIAPTATPGPVPTVAPAAAPVASVEEEIDIFA
ncbi:MAG TPA: hypothetical protein VGM30_10395 [Puia sp.]|jgi:hypothetical protein